MRRQLDLAQWREPDVLAAEPAAYRLLHGPVTAHQRFVIPQDLSRQQFNAPLWTMTPVDAASRQSTPI